MVCSSRIIRERQRAIRREMERRHIAIKIVAQDSGIHPATLATYFPADPQAEPAQIPGGAIYALCDTGALPADLLSLLLPNGWQIVRAPEEIDHDAVADWAEKYQRTKLAAHREDSPMGPQIAPCEDDTLRGIVVEFPAGVAA